MEQIFKHVSALEQFIWNNCDQKTINKWNDYADEILHNECTKYWGEIPKQLKDLAMEYGYLLIKEDKK